MTLPPAWKVRRELLRPFRILVGLPRRLIWYLFATRYYDIYLSRFRKVWKGKRDLGRKVVVYVIYPSNGVPGSTLLTLDHIGQSGYSALVVSNLTLSDTDRAAVLSRSARLIERRNFGYDFGAYRDGVLCLRDDFRHLERLVLLNDSVWYPLHGARNWLLEAEEMGHDLVGATSHGGTPRGLLNTSIDTDFDWTYSTLGRNFHYGSFALSFGSAIICDNSFLKFWERLSLERKKNRVVRAGEIALTRWVVNHGYSHDCIYNPATLDAVLRSLSSERLREVAYLLILPDHAGALRLKKETLKRNQAIDRKSRKELHRLILASVSNQGMVYAAPSLIIHDMKFPFLKKSPLRLSADSASSTMLLIEKLEGEMGAAIKQEAASIYAKRPA
jgi:hypothetical protein